MFPSSTWHWRAGVLAFIIGIAFATGACGNSPKGPNCKSDKDCSTGKVCAFNRCVDCAADGDCPKGKRCSDFACVAATCQSDGDCADGQVCQAGVCKSCASDAECGPGGTCVAGACQRGKKCATDTECADDEDCINGYCTAAVKAGAAGSCPLVTVYFAFDSSSVDASERERLDANSRCLADNKGKAIFLVGHTDSSGTEEYNIALSERRAQAVADYVSRLGTDPARLQVVPKGETEPTGQGDDKDRRVEFQWK